MVKAAPLTMAARVRIPLQGHHPDHLDMMLLLLLNALNLGNSCNNGALLWLVLLLTLVL